MRGGFDYLLIFEKSIPIHLVFSLESKAILSVIVSGTAKNIPAGPKTHPQNINEKNITAGESPKPSPMNFGSNTFDMRLFMTRYTSER